MPHYGRNAGAQINSLIVAIIFEFGIILVGFIRL